MLDNETKRRLTQPAIYLSAKCQTLKSGADNHGSVYKFMDDMDKEAIELGGKPSLLPAL